MVTSAEAELDRLLASVARDCTVFRAEPSSDPPADSQLESHFGGQPYFESGERWPTAQDGTPLDFVFQVFNSTELQLPPEIELVQFYFSWDLLPFETEEDGWLVKLYHRLDRDRVEPIERPAELDEPRFCAMTFEAATSLPDWEGIDLYADVDALTSAITPDDPWTAFQQSRERVLGAEPDVYSQLGGYPMWIQAESTPSNAADSPLRLLFQIDSDPNAGLTWGDVGLAYVFLDPDTGEIHFELQSH